MVILFKRSKSDVLLNMVSDSLIYLPTPLNVSALWNFGSLLGVCLLTQLVTGILLSLHYFNSVDFAFSSVVELGRNVNYGWLLRSIHTNGASMFFICMYIHVGRGVYYGSYRFFHTWMVGVSILLLTMATSFLGYVLPWGQMSFWGATVITNLLSTVPYAGGELVCWLWGGFSVGGPTLTRFFSFHFILPFIISAFFLIHIMYLHSSGSNNPLGLMENQIKLAFHPYYSAKDMVGVFVFSFLFSGILFFYPFILSDPDNFILANPCLTPPHIQPEWYYLFPYAILRSIPSKLGGVVALFFSILILYALPFMPKKKYRSNSFYPLNQILFWSFVVTLILLTWVGSQPVQVPFIFGGRVLTLVYFSYYMIDPVVAKLWEMSFTEMEI